MHTYHLALFVITVITAIPYIYIYFTSSQQKLPFHLDSVTVLLGKYDGIMYTFIRSKADTY